MKDVPRDGFANMAIDEALKAGAGATGESTLRIYSFAPPAVTIGRFQPLEGFMRPDACLRAGVDLVRRPTGGRAILHLHDLTYSVTRPASGDEIAEGKKTFEFVGRGIAAALRYLGVEAVLSEHDGAGGTVGWCFEREFGVDIEWRGRKICGSAQRISEGSLLQHGSLFLRSNLDLMSILTGQEMSHEGFVTVSEAAGREVSFEELSRCLESGFREAMDLEMREAAVTEEEEAVARGLIPALEDAGVRASSGRIDCDIIVKTPMRHGEADD